MEERIIIQSEYNKKALRGITILMLILLIVAVWAFFSAFLEWDQDCHFWVNMTRGGYYERKPQMIDYAGFWISVAAIVLFVAGIVFKIMAKKCSLTVTQNRIYGRTTYGKQVDLPVTSFSSIEKGSLSGIGISTPTDFFNFIAVKNQDDIYNVLSQLLNNRQAAAYQVAVPVVYQNPTAAYQSSPVVTQSVPVIYQNAPVAPAVNIQPQPQPQAQTNIYSCPACRGQIVQGQPVCNSCGTGLNW